MTNVDRIVKRKRETGSAVQLRISMVIRDDTIDEMPVFVQWAADHGLDEVMLAADLVGRVTDTAATHVQTKIAECYAIADRNPGVTLVHLSEFDRLFAAEHRVAPVRPSAPGSRLASPCSIPNHTLLVSFDGIVRPCCVSWYVLGNLNAQSVYEVWSGDAARAFRGRMAAGDFRDCSLRCPYNARPVSRSISTLRQGLSSLRRNPRETGRKVLRRLGLTTAQSDFVFKE